MPVVQETVVTMVNHGQYPGVPSGVTDMTDSETIWLTMVTIVLIR